MKKQCRMSKDDERISKIKDAIDDLHKIKSKKKRLEAARDLVEYIHLHHIDQLR